jgi:hypothetical protein
MTHVKSRHRSLLLAVLAASIPGISAAEPAPARIIAPESAAESGAKGADQARIEVSGKIQGDFIYDLNRVDPDWNMTLRPSKIPINCTAAFQDAGCGKDGETIFSVRQTLVQFKGFIPTKAGELKTELSLDLFQPQSASTAFRLLNAYAQFGNWAAGQYYTLFMNIDVFPNTIDYWGPNGMTFIRNPQVRYTMPLGKGNSLAFSLEAPGSAIDPGKVSIADPALGIRARTKLPDLIGRYAMERDWGQFQVAAMLRNVGYETSTNPPDFTPSGSKTGGGISLNGFYSIGKTKDRVTGQLVFGKGIASYMNDGGVDLAPNLADRAAQTVKSVGGFVYYDHYWSDQWSSSFGGSMHRQTNTDGQLFNAFHQGMYSSVNLLYYPAKNIVTGGEFLWGKNEQKDGASASDKRVQFSAQFKF